MRQMRTARHWPAQERAGRARRVAVLAAVGVALGIVLALGLGRHFSPRGAVAGAGSAGSAEEVTEPTMTASERRVEEVRTHVAANCTGSAPLGLTDPKDYDELGLQLMERIDEQRGGWEGFKNADDFTYEAVRGDDGKVCPYLIAVNRAADTVTVMAQDGDGRYTVPYAAFVCSTGDKTPIGYFRTPGKSSWHALFGNVYGQYVTRIDGNILFHSVPYYTQHKDDEEYEEYNKLGTPASLGCVRLAVCDVKWIYDNCPNGTPVVIYDDADVPGSMGKPGTIALETSDDDPASATYRGFDPTDPDEANPWDERFRTGTAIRSEAAQEEWEAAPADGRWAASVNPTDLQGFSTNAASRG